MPFFASLAGIILLIQAVLGGLLSVGLFFGVRAGTLMSDNVEVYGQNVSAQDLEAYSDMTQLMSEYGIFAVAVFFVFFSLLPLCLAMVMFLLPGHIASKARKG